MKESPQDNELSTLRKNLEAAQKELEHLERIKPLASAAAAVVHDIRNSLGVIQSTAQFVLSKLQPAEREKEAWQLVERNVESIRNLLKGYLGLARQTESPKKQVSINELVTHVCHFVAVLSAKNNVRIITELDSNISTVLIESSAVESAILNLSINAIEAMPEGGTLKFMTKADPAAKTVTLQIEDSGPGIPSEIREKLFTPFSTTKENGTGMGLYSAKAIMVNNDGKISCESRPGKTTMTLTFNHG